MHKLGGPSVLKVVETEIPAPKPHCVRVKLEVTGVSLLDTIVRKQGLPPGYRFPFIPGSTVIGHIDELGEFVSNVKKGQRIAALVDGGSYSQYVCLPAKDLVPLPDSLDAREAEAVIFDYLAAYQMLHRYASVTKAQHVLVHAAGSTIGRALLELAKPLGATLYAADSARQLRHIKNFDAQLIDTSKQQLIPRVAELTNNKGMDVIFDPYDNWHVLKSYRCLASCGRLLMYRLSHCRLNRFKRFCQLMNSPWISMLSLLHRNRLLAGYQVLAVKHQHPDWYHEDLTAVIKLLAEQKIHPLLGEALPLTEAAKAHQLVEDPATVGRIILNV